MSERSASANGVRSYPLLLLTVALGGILAPLNSTMLAVALPDLRDALGVGHAEIAWLVSAYLIAMAVAQPLGGRLGDQLGRANVFRVGLLLFLGFSLAAAASPGYIFLIVCRTGQALVGAAVIPNGFAMLRESVPVNRLGRSGGVLGSAMSAAAAIGPLLGAALLGIGSWRLIFLVNVPLVLAAFTALHFLGYRSTRARESVSLDWLGAGLFAATLALMTVMFSVLRGDASPAVTIAVVGAFAAFGALFVWQQFSARTPIAEWRLFKVRSYAAATGFILLSNLVMYTTILAIPFFLEEVQGKGSGATGLLLGAVSVPVAIMSPIGGRLSDSLGRRPLVFTGSVLILLGSTALLAEIAPGVPYALLALSLLVMGIGLGLSVGPSGAAAIESTPLELAGTSAGTNSMMRYTGSIIGAGILGAVLNTDSGAPDVDLFRAIFAVLVVVSACGTVTTLFIHRYFRATGPVREMSAPALASSDSG